MDEKDLNDLKESYETAKNKFKDSIFEVYKLYYKSKSTISSKFKKIEENKEEIAKKITDNAINTLNEIKKVIKDENKNEEKVETKKEES